jgi:hypothetical protein
MILLLQLAGFCALLLASPRHQQDWLRRKRTTHTSSRLRACAFLLVVSAALPAGLGLGWRHGAVVWFGWLIIAAGLVVAINTNRDRILTRMRR